MDRQNEGGEDYLTGEPSDLLQAERTSTRSASKAIAVHGSIQVDDQTADSPAWRRLWSILFAPTHET